MHDFDTFWFVDMSSAVQIFVPVVVLAGVDSADLFPMAKRKQGDRDTGAFTPEQMKIGRIKKLKAEWLSLLQRSFTSFTELQEISLEVDRQLVRFWDFLMFRFGAVSFQIRLDNGLKWGEARVCW